jgi:hypothetical protein
VLEVRRASTHGLPPVLAEGHRVQPVQPVPEKYIEHRIKFFSNHQKMLEMNNMQNLREKKEKF